MDTEVWAELVVLLLLLSLGKEMSASLEICKEVLSLVPVA